MRGGRAAAAVACGVAAIIETSVSVASAAASREFGSMGELVSRVEHRIIRAASDGGKAPPTLRPEMLVRFTQGGPACLEPSDLQAMIMYSMRGEETKTRSLMVEHGGGCVMLSPEQRYKVISVDEQNSELGFGLIEVVGEDVIAGRGAWAFSLGVEEAKRGDSKKNK